MLTRRDFLQVAAATAAMTGLQGQVGRAAASQAISQDSLLEFESLGQVTLLNFTDCHAQLMPLYFREPSVNIGVGEVHGLPPHLTGKAALETAMVVAAVYGAVANLAVGAFAGLAVARGVRAALRRGVIYRDAAAWEQCARVTAAVFCARGTLVRGEPELVEVEVFETRAGKVRDADQVLVGMVQLAIRRADDAEWRALRARAGEVSPPVEQIEVIELMGLSMLRRGDSRAATELFEQALALSADVAHIIEDRIRGHLERLASG